MVVTRQDVEAPVPGAALPGTVTVVGSLNLDLVVEVDQLPAVGATLGATGYRTDAGGKGLNQAVAARRQGATVSMVGAVGSDQAGRDLLALLVAEGIDASEVEVRDDDPSGLALVTVARGGANTIVVVAGSNARVTPGQAVAGIERQPPAVVLTQMEVPVESVHAALDAARRVGAVGILNPAPATGPLPLDLLALASIVVPNETEAAAMTGRADPDAAARALVAAGSATVVVTLGERGALIAGSGADGGGGRVQHVPAFQVTATDTTAAGDAFCGTLAAALASGASLTVAVRRACAAGALAATAPGAVASIPGAAAVTALAQLAPLAGDRR